MREKVAVYLRKSRGDIEDLEKHKMQLLDICKKMIIYMIYMKKSEVVIH